MAALVLIPFLDALGLSGAISKVAGFVGLGESAAATAGTLGTGVVAGQIAKPIDQAALNAYNNSIGGQV